MTTPFPGNANWPSDWQGCRIIGTFLNTLGELQSGSLSVTPSPVALVDRQFKMVITGATKKVDLVNGHCDFMVPATDDIDVDPSSWTYHVVENWPGGRTYDITAPQGQTVYLSDVSPVGAADGSTIMRGEPGTPGASSMAAWQANTAYLANAFVSYAGGSYFAAANVPARAAFLASDWVRLADQIFVNKQLPTVVITGGAIPGLTDASQEIADGIAKLYAAGGGTMLFQANARYTWSGNATKATNPLSLSDALCFVGIPVHVMGANPNVTLFLDNLVYSATDKKNYCGTDAITFIGAADNCGVSNLRVKFARPDGRNVGNGLTFLGFPGINPTSATFGWDAWHTPKAQGGIGGYSTGALVNPFIHGVTVENAGQVGAIFMGCFNPRVTNFQAKDTYADGLHFNACCMGSVAGYTYSNSYPGLGDDALPFVTYFDAAKVATSPAGPFYQPSVGLWSNYNLTATGFSIYGGRANGIRLNGARNVVVGGGSIANKSAGISVDSAIKGGGADPVNNPLYGWTVAASVGCRLHNIAIDSCPTGYTSQMGNVSPEKAAAAGLTLSMLTDFDVDIDNVRAANCTSRPFYIDHNPITGDTPAYIKGHRYRDCSAVVNGLLTGSLGALFSGLQSSAITDFTQTNINGTGQALRIQGSSVATGGSAGLVSLPQSSLLLRDVHVSGASLIVQDVGQLRLRGSLSSSDSPSSGVQLVRVADIDGDGLITTRRWNRANDPTTVSAGVVFTRVARGGTRRIVLITDALNAGAPYAALYINGTNTVDASLTDTDLDVRYESAQQWVYGSTTVAPTDDVNFAAAGAGNKSPAEYSVLVKYRHSGAATPAWASSSRCVGTKVQELVGEVAPAAGLKPGPGSRYTDHSTGRRFTRPTVDAWWLNPSMLQSASSPTAANDSTTGAYVGLMWQRTGATQEFWVCFDATVGAAVWRKATLT